MTHGIRYLPNASEPL
ncbi:CRISPR-associated DxTHG motif protein [Clostridium sp. AF19-22AC]|nr:CRISPR-associated DxTHG motif protein [Clostridium sp. AF19-22AC]